MGGELIRAKDLGGHKRFMDWLEEGFPFSHSTALNYMRDAEANIKFATVANMFDEALSQVIELSAAKRARRKTDKAERQAYAALVAEKAERGEIPASLSDIKQQRGRARPKRFQSYRESLARGNVIADGVALRRIERNQRQEEARAQGLPDLSTWRPHHDASGFSLWVRLPDPDAVPGLRRKGQGRHFD